MCCVRCVVGCVFKILVGASKIWVVPRIFFVGLAPLPWTPSLLPPADSPSPDRPKFRSLFFLPPQLSFFPLSSGGLLVENMGAVQGRILHKVRVRAAASGPPGLHTTARELQTCTYQGPGASNTTKIPRKDPQEREERKKIVAEEGKKSAKFWAPTFRRPHPSGPPPFGAPTLRGRPFLGLPPPARADHLPTLKTLRRHVGLKRCWPKSGLAQTGRCHKFHQEK